MDLNVGTKLVCIIDNSPVFASCEVVEIERIAESGGDSYYKFKGYKDWFDGKEVKRFFRIY